MNFCVFIACLIWNGNLVLSNKQEIIEDLKNIIYKIKNSGDDFRPGPATIPAFTAILSKTFTPLANQIIKFDSVNTNVGGHYSSSTGVFTPPRDGIYMISATIRSTGGQHLHCALWVNDVIKEKIFGTNYTTGTVNAVLKLRKGDRVFIKKDQHSGEYILGSSWSMFSGYFIA